MSIGMRCRVGATALFAMTVGVAVLGVTLVAHGQPAKPVVTTKVVTRTTTTTTKAPASAPAPVVAKARTPKPAKVVLVAKAAPAPASAPAVVVTTTTAPPPVTVATAVAQPVATAATMSVSEFLDWLLKLAGIILAALIPLLLNRWLGGKVSADQLAAYSKLAVDAVGHTEELGHQAIKNGTAAPNSDAKLDAAVAYVAQAAKVLNLRPMDESAIKQLVDAKLGTSRATLDKGRRVSCP